MVLIKIFKNLKKLIDNSFLNHDEKKFIIKSINRNYDKRKKNVLIELSVDYYYLYYYKLLINDEKFSNYNIIGLWPYFHAFNRKKPILFDIFFEWYNKISNFFIRKKFIKLYKSIGVSKFINLYKFDSSTMIQSEISDRKEILKFKIDKIQVGDLIYDTYVRFRGLPTISFKDNFLKKLFNNSLMILKNLNKIHTKYNIKFFFTTYTSYLHHGLATRFFLKKNIPTFSGINANQYNKKLSLKDDLHNENFNKYLNILKKIDKKEINQAYISDYLKKKYKGKSENQYNYLKTNPFKKQIITVIQKKLLKNIKGVLFLHDFYDSPWNRRKIIFNDYYLWTIYSLMIIQKYNLPIAVKPHPNSNEINSDVFYLIKRLKNRYRKIIWIDSDFSNKILFKKINFGISVSGSVLFELAYHKIKSIACGVHPGVDFGFTINVYCKNSYKNTLLNIDKIKMPSYFLTDLNKFYYMYNFYQKDDYATAARKINLRHIDFTTSKGLNFFSDNKK
jgi:hypothetical protein